MSLGNDGKVFVWELVSGRKELTIIKGFRLLTESIPRSVRISKAKGNTAVGGICTMLNLYSGRATLSLGTCLSFSSEDKSLFVVGSENGGIYKCSLHSSTTTSISSSTLETEFPSPIKFCFRPHYGPVYGLSCSPFHRNLFLSCGTDATTRLYSLLDVSSITINFMGLIFSH